MQNNNDLIFIIAQIRHLNVPFHQLTIPGNPALKALNRHTLKNFQNVRRQFQR